MRAYTPTPAKRGLRRSEAAEYVGLSPSGFDAWVRAGRLPGPIKGTKIYDAKALAAAMDRLSGLAKTEDPDDFEQWLDDNASAA